MRLSPLANLVAVASPDPGELSALRERLEGDHRFDAPWSPAPGCLIAACRLPGSEPDGEAAREAGLAFAQGREAACSGEHDWASVAKLVAERPDGLDELPGDFGFVHVRPTGEATVIRSAGGLVPFYVAGDGVRWTVTTALALLLRFHPGEPQLDPLINAIWTSGYDAAPDRRTFFTGVRVLGRGEFVQLGQGEPRFGRWWNPRSDVEPRPAADHAERLRSALIGTLERELDPDGENLLALSGGVDSSAVGFLAAGLLGRDVSTLTVLPENEEARRKDVEHVDALSAAVGFHRRTTLALDRERRLSLLDEPRVPFHVLQPYLCLVPSVAREWPVKVLFGGEFADHTVGSRLTLRDWAHHTTAAGLWRSRNALPTGPADLRRWFIHRLRRALHRPQVPWPAVLPDLIRSDLRAEYREWFHDRRREAARDEGPMPYLAMFLERTGFLGMHWEVTSSVGMRRCFPFVTRELVELGFECHPSELVGPGVKKLLRAALRDDVPAMHLERPEEVPTPVADGGSWEWAGEVPEELDSVLAPGWAAREQLPYWDLLRVRQLLAFSTAVEVGRKETGSEGHA